MTEDSTGEPDEGQLHRARRAGARYRLTAGLTAKPASIDPRTEALVAP